MHPLQRSAAALAIALLCAGAAAAAPLEAPYQLDGMAVDLRNRGADPAADLTFAFLFDLGPLQAPRQADADRWFEATVLTEAGPVRAGLLDIRKSCEFVCGVDPSMAVEETETCHYQAALVLDPKSDTGGANLLAAFPGEVEISDFEMLTPLPLNVSGDWSEDFNAPLWPANGLGPMRIDEFDAAAGTLRLSLRNSGGEQSVETRGCRATEAAGLTQIACPEVAVLAADGVPLLASWPDYNEPGATPVATFRHEGELYVLVRLGLSAETVYGLLLRRGSGWLPLFRRAERPLLC